MKKTLAIILALLLPLTASAVYIVDQGGTGSTTLSGLLKGNGKNMVQTATAGTDYVLPSALSSYLTLSSWYATTTDGLDEGLTNLYFTNARAQSALTGYFATTTTSNTWSGAQTFGTLTASTGTIDHLVTDELTAKTSGGSVFRASNGTPVSVLGVGNSANVLFYGGVNIDGAVRMATSLNGLALLTNGAVTSIATSSLGLLTTNVAEGSNLYFTNPRVQTYLDTLSKGYFFSTTSADAWDSTKSRWSTTSNTYWLTQQTTDGLAQGSTNKYFANSLVDTWLGTKNLGVFWSTTSADAWHLTKTDVAFSTTSADYWISLYSKGFFFSTTSADYWLTTKGISAASSTLYGDNGTFSGSNQFASLNWTNATGSRATTTSLAVTSVTSALHLANATGGVGAYGGTSCTNQFVRSLSALGAATCATVGAADVSLANLTATNGTLTFSGTYNGATARTIGLNLANANTWTGGQIFGNSTTTSATTTKLFATTASTSALYLSTGTCSGSSALTVTNGLVGCGAISSGSASSTLLGDNNLFSGNNIFNSITRSTSTQATSTNFFSTYVVGTNGTITNLLATNSTTTNATSTTGYFSGVLSGLQSGFTGRISPVKRLSYITATSTAWTATTSGAYLPPIIAPFAGTIQTAQCSTDAGTLNVDIYHTTTHLTLFNASTTVGTITFSSNNTVTNGEKMYISAGTPASSPTVLSCTLSLTESL